SPWVPRGASWRPSSPRWRGSWPRTWRPWSTCRDARPASSSASRPRSPRETLRPVERRVRSGRSPAALDGVGSSLRGAHHRALLLTEGPQVRPEREPGHGKLAYGDVAVDLGQQFVHRGPVAPTERGGDAGVSGQPVRHERIHLVDDVVDQATVARRERAEG